ncbi:MAG: response regulator transcription factor [Actinomycetota bacterium]
MIHAVDVNEGHRTTADPDTAITVLIVDDHDIVREGLAAILGREPGLRVVGQVESAEEALTFLRTHDPTVVVLDDELPGMDVAGLCGIISEERLRAHVVVLSRAVDEPRATAAIAAGAQAFVVKDVGSSELKRAIRAAARGETLDAAPSAHGGGVLGAAAPSEVHLRPSELRVLRLLVEGMSVAEIASTTGLSRHTIKTYLRTIYRKLGVSSRAEAASFALRRGLA